MARGRTKIDRSRFRGKVFRSKPQLGIALLQGEESDISLWAVRFPDGKYKIFLNRGEAEAAYESGVAVLDAPRATPMRRNPHPRRVRKLKRNPRGVRIVHNKLLGGWYVVTGPHQTPLNGRFNSKAEAEAWLNRRSVNKNPKRKRARTAAYRVTHKRGKVRVKKLRRNPAASYVIKAKHTTGKPYWFNGAGFNSSKSAATVFNSLSNAKREAKRLVNRLPFSILSIGVHKT